MTANGTAWRRVLVRRRQVLPLLGLTTLAAFFIVGDVRWLLQSAAMGGWNRFHEKFMPAPELHVTEKDKVIVYWTPFFGNLEYNVGYGRAPFENCPVSDCVTTNQRSYLERASAVVFHPMEFSDLDLPSWRHPDQLWVFFMLESPPHTTAKFTEATRHLFNLTVTYRRDSDIRQPYFVVERLPESERRPAQVTTGRPTPPWAALARRKGRLPWVVSHCRTPGKREEFVEELRSYIAVDVFGRCGPLKCSPPGGLFTLPDPRTCYRHLAENYHFYLSLENSRCRDYITEKFFLALNSSLVPVVYGARREDYAAVAPPHSFIHVDDFESARELASYLRYLTAHPAALDAYTAWRGEYRVRGAVHDSWCKLCERLHDASAPRSTHPDINAWWNGPDTCW